MEESGSWWILAIIATFDLYWILRLAFQKLISKIRSKIRYDEDSVNYSLCWTTDIDYFLHMNNGKYFREMDFGRFDWYFRTGLSDYLEARPGVHFVQHGASIRYRRSIDFLVPFKLVTKLIYWDDRSLYFEQRFVSLHDGFIRAVALCKNTCIGATIQEMADVIQLPATPPSIPEELKLWIQCQEVSSNRLRMAGYGRSVGTGLSSIDSSNTSGELANIEEENITTLNCEEKMPEEAAQAALSAKESNQSSQNIRMNFWRAAGLTYIQYSNIAARCTRNALKKELQTEAAKRGDLNIKFQKWENGKAILKMNFWRAAGLTYVQYSNIAARCTRNALRKEMQTEAQKRGDLNIKFQKWENGKAIGTKA